MSTVTFPTPATPKLIILMEYSFNKPPAYFFSFIGYTLLYEF